MNKILLVDDEPFLLAALQRALRKNFAVEIACGGAAGLVVLKNPQDFAVVVADMQMPEMNGVEFLAKVKVLAPDVVRMMLTGNADQRTAIDAVNEGHIFRFLNKPCSPEKIADALNAGIRQHQLITAERDLLENTLRGAIKVLTEILAMADPKGFGNAEVIRDNMRRMGEVLKVPDLWQLEVAAMLSHIGSVTIPPDLMLKVRQGHLISVREKEMLERIPAIGGELLGRIPRLEAVGKMLTYQNKRFDGTGFPLDGVSGNDIPLGARMLKVLCDLADLEAQGKPRPAALETLRKRAGWYDPLVMALMNSPAHTESLERPNKVKSIAKIPLAELRIGHLLTADVETKDGTLIVTAGHPVTSALLARLRNFSTLSGIKEPIIVEA